MLHLNKAMDSKADFIPVFLLFIFCVNWCPVVCESTFVVSFQKSGGWSTNEWVEINKSIPVLNEFTACHWEKIRYFSSDIMTPWSYCIAEELQRDDLNCTQIYSSGNGTTTDQQLVLEAWVNGGGDMYEVNIEKYRHRTWNHICWSYSTLTNVTRF